MNHNKNREGRKRNIDVKLRSRRIETLVKKAVELAMQHEVDLLLVVYSPDTKSWIEYSSKDAGQLFFGLQAAKEHMDKVETFHNDKIKALLKTDAKETSTSPPPTKRLKQATDESQFSEPTDKVRKGLDSDASTLSTNETLPKLSRIKGSPTNTNLELSESTELTTVPFNFADMIGKQDSLKLPTTLADLDPDDFLF
ncbi:unnamed protein product [Blepharisma stoltei]|uniref:MADS-box domain-containing protein n=1 Tax=Blepharisma stoltei TaxID=1481888 RepID=A0AAU9K9R7_9CILI|nr:unnamed protein product [Blepharisma stoltei]